jgi:hypothetical protein
MERSPSGIITCERSNQSQSATSQQRGAAPQSLYSTRMDSVIHQVTMLPAMKSLLSVTHHDYLPNEFEPVLLETDVYFELKDLKVVDGHLDSIKFMLTCYEHDVQHLQEFVDNCNAAYERRMANKLGTHRYYFDQMVQSKAKGNMQNPLPTTHLVYTKAKFVTSRTFDNVFFEDRARVQSRTQFFLQRRDWYDAKGIPYTLGFLYHGPPGTGKTSTIKAIANEGRRHIINIQLSEIKTKQQLQHLFFNDEIYVFNGANTEKYIIPIAERLYVIEDIDAMGDAVLKREWKKPVVPEKPKEKVGDAWMDNKEHDDEIKDPIDLSFLLNLLDGTLEASGRILAISSNFPERIDRALIRPGRIDMIVHFKKCNRQILREMVSNFYDITLDDWTTDELDYKWSPAEVNQILFRNFGSATEAIDELKTLNSTDLYGFTSE